MATEGVDIKPLAKKLGKTKGILYRWLDGDQNPRVEQINVLVQELPISAEQLLVKMGVHMSPDEVTNLPTRMLDLMLTLTPQQVRLVEDLVRQLATVSEK